ARDRKAHAIDDVVETRFEHAQQVLAGVALQARRLGVVVAELALEQTVNALDLLLLAQLHGVVGQTRLLAAGAVLARLPLEFALRSDRAGRALEAEIGAFATREFEFGTEITCHVDVLFSKSPATERRFLIPAVKDDRKKSYPAALRRTA